MSLEEVFLSLIATEDMSTPTAAGEEPAHE